MSAPADGCLSNLVLDRLIGQELDEEARAAARVHLKACERCSARLGQLEQERDLFRAAPPPFSQPEPASRRTARALAAGSVIAAGAAVGLLFFMQRAEEPEPDVTQIKGGVRLGFYVKRADAVQRGRSGDVVHPGDAIRFAFTSFSPGYLMVLSRDGAGRVSVYYAEGERAAPIEPGEDVLLPGSITLDDVLGLEEIHALHCAAPVPVAPVVEALQQSGDTFDSIAGCTAERLTLDKRP